MIALSLLALVGLRILDRPLQTAAAPAGIVSFELAGDIPSATLMVAQWGPDGKVYAGLSLGFDYLFMLAYGSALALGCALIAGRVGAGLARTVGLGLAWLQFVAAGLDGVENFALIQLLLGSRQPGWPPLALWCASIKFVLIGLGLLYILIGGLGLVIRRRAGR
jgi:hypothetical protein